jgi:phage tail-like protein
MRRSSISALVLSAGLVAFLGGTASAGNRKDPLSSYSFSITLHDGQQSGEAFFRSCGGLTTETDVVEVREGGANDTTHKLPGRAKWQNLVLKRGFAGLLQKDPVQQWARDVFAGHDVRKDITVVMRDGDQTELARFEFHRCFPVRWEVGPLYSPRDPASAQPASLEAPPGEMCLETIEIAHEGMEVK